MRVAALELALEIGVVIEPSIPAEGFATNRLARYPPDCDEWKQRDDCEYCGTSHTRISLSPLWDWAPLTVCGRAAVRLSGPLKPPVLRTTWLGTSPRQPDHSALKL